MKKLRPCPFCGKEVKMTYPSFDFVKSHNLWNLNHFCPHPEGDMGVVLSVYGKTVAEVADRWNGGVDYGEVNIAD